MGYLFAFEAAVVRQDIEGEIARLLKVTAATHILMSLNIPASHILMSLNIPAPLTQSRVMVQPFHSESKLCRLHVSYIIDALHYLILHPFHSESKVRSANVSVSLLPLLEVTAATLAQQMCQ